MNGTCLCSTTETSTWLLMRSTCLCTSTRTPTTLPLKRTCLCITAEMIHCCRHHDWKVDFSVDKEAPPLWHCWNVSVAVDNRYLTRQQDWEVKETDVEQDLPPQHTETMPRFHMRKHEDVAAEAWTVHASPLCVIPCNAQARSEWLPGTRGTVLVVLVCVGELCWTFCPFWHPSGAAEFAFEILGFGFLVTSY